MSSSTAFYADSAAPIVGYLGVRLEGGVRNHTNGTTYSTQLKGVGVSATITIAGA